MIKLNKQWPLFKLAKENLWLKDDDTLALLDLTPNLVGKIIPSWSGQFSLKNNLVIEQHYRDSTLKGISVLLELFQAHKNEFQDTLSDKARDSCT